MKIEHLLAACVRLFAIALFIHVIRTVVQMVVFAQDNGFEFAFIAYSGSAITVLIIAILLWKFPLTVSRRISNFPEVNKECANDINTFNLVQTGSIVLGLYFLYQVISDIFYWAYYAMALSRDPEKYLDFTLESEAAIFSTAVEFIAALYLILGSRKLTEIALRIRYGNQSDL